jgi:hypothetical protein
MRICAERVPVPAPTYANKQDQPAAVPRAKTCIQDSRPLPLRSELAHCPFLNFRQVTAYFDHTVRAGRTLFSARHTTTHTFRRVHADQQFTLSASREIRRMAETTSSLKEHGWAYQCVLPSRDGGWLKHPLVVITECRSPAQNRYN